MKKIVITGGTFAGKTTLIEAFAREGYQTIPEAAMQIIDETTEKMGMEAMKKWRRDSIGDFQTLIANRVLKLESEIQNGKDNLIFCDRGLHDSLGYLKLVSAAVPEAIVPLFSKHKYDLVFLCDVIKNFDIRSSTGRIENYKSSYRAGELIGESYKKYGHKVIRVKEMTVASRIKFVKKHLDLLK